MLLCIDNVLELKLEEELKMKKVLLYGVVCYAGYHALKRYTEIVYSAGKLIGCYETARQVVINEMLNAEKEGR